MSQTKISRDGEAVVEVEVSNQGTRVGVEVVQLYVEDVVTSATWARRELKAWKRVEVEAGQTLRVRLELKAADLWILDAEGRRAVEPGRFRILVGNSSRDTDLKETWLTVE